MKPKPRQRIRPKSDAHYVIGITMAKDRFNNGKPSKVMVESLQTYLKLALGCEVTISGIYKQD